MSNPGAAAPPLKDGEALDRLSDRAERWAKKYAQPNDEDAFRADYDKKFRSEAEDLATKSTQGARPFGLKEWILAVPLWLILAGGAFVLSILLMQPDTLWFWIYAAIAVLIFLAGIGAVYFDTTSEKRAQKRHADKVEWLLNASRRNAMDVLRGRQTSTTKG
ncbi:MAG: hypothetical protein ACTHXA_12925 [Gulosibacter sp.]|uniref:hypothetical protein n=1 Tax=Gulosibacter sp. TaxID=2817531 RepID=UPI003F93E09B